MKKLFLLLTAYSISSQLIYCQNTGVSKLKNDTINLKEINIYLAEGLECKELLVSKDSELQVADSLLLIADSIMKLQDQEIDQYVEAQKKLIDKTNQLIENLKTEMQNTLDESNKRRVWSNIAFVESGIIAILLSILNIN